MSSWPQGFFYCFHIFLITLLLHLDIILGGITKSELKKKKKEVSGYSWHNDIFFILPRSKEMNTIQMIQQLLCQMIPQLIF